MIVTSLSTFYPTGECLKQPTPDAKEQTSSATKQVPHSPPPSTEQIEHPPTESIHSPPPPPKEQLALPSTFISTEQIDSPPLPPTQQTHSPLPLPKEQIDCSPPPTATHPSLLSLPPQSPVRRYADYLRAFYQTSELPANDKWPPSPSELFINLTVISRERVSRTDMLEIMLASLHGDMDKILNIKVPIEIGKILSSHVQPGRHYSVLWWRGLQVSANQHWPGRSVNSGERESAISNLP